MAKNIFIFINLLLVSVFCNAQNSVINIKGRVFDAEQNQALPFVTVSTKIGSQMYGGSSDIDGRFSINVPQTPDSLKFSYVGYKTKTIKFSGEPSVEVLLKRTQFNLREVVILPGINPADLIMEKVIANRDINNPEKSVSFTYESYNKFTMGLTEPIMFSTDEDLKDEERARLSKFDSISNIFLMESVAERSFIPPSKSYEKVVATKVSGVQNPFFALLATEFQSFSLYTNHINILDKNFLSPVAKGATRDYLFIIEDTLNIGSTDTTFVLSFRPKKGKKFTALTGLLYINTNKYAVEMAIAVPVERLTDNFNVMITQKYEFIDDKQWFPVQLNAEFIFGDNDKGFINDVKVIKDTWNDDGTQKSKPETDSTTVEKKESEPDLKAISKSYIRNIKINPEINKREFSNIAVEIIEDASKKDDDFWQENRAAEFSEYDLLSYQFVDSLGERYKFDKKIKALTALGSGRFPIKFIDFDLTQLMRVNAYEGFRLGGGLYTNDKISKHFSVGGYFAYGFNDKETKFGGSAQINLNKRKTSFLRYSYSKDVEETGRINSPFKEPFIVQASLRQFFVNRMDLFERHKLQLNFRSLGYLQSEIFIKQENRLMTHNYLFSEPLTDNVRQLSNNFSFYESGWHFRYAHKEKIMRSQVFDVPLPTKFPVVKGFLGRGFIFENEGFEYTRYQLQLEKVLLTKKIGETHITIRGGGVIGDVPYFLWENAPGTFYQSPRSGLYLMANEGFETIIMNEFFNEQYAYLFFKHNFKSLLFSYKKFKPQLALAFNMGIGSADEQSLLNHREVAFETFEKGFYEGGLLLNNLFTSGFSGFGIGAFYRFGPYAYENTSDNLFIKFTTTFTF
jgi:hypothetical protein